MHDKPKRRWPRFTLRTLFVVVTLLSCWLAWQLSVVRERQTVLNELRASGFQAVTASQWSSYAINGMRVVTAGQHANYAINANRPVPEVSWVREWFGDEAIQWIGFPAEHDFDESERRRLHRLFPEADLLQLQKLDSPSSFPFLAPPRRESDETVRNA